MLRWILACCLTILLLPSLVAAGLPPAPAAHSTHCAQAMQGGPEQAASVALRIAATPSWVASSTAPAKPCPACASVDCAACLTCAVCPLSGAAATPAGLVFALRPAATLHWPAAHQALPRSTAAAPELPPPIV